jgi:hypothetical protein
VQQTIAKRMRAELLEIKETLYRMCHLPVPEQGRWLGQVRKDRAKDFWLIFTLLGVRMSQKSSVTQITNLVP